MNHPRCRSFYYRSGTKWPPQALRLTRRQYGVLSGSRDNSADSVKTPALAAMKTTSFRVVTIAFLLASFGACTRLHAGWHRWTGEGANANWSNPANWHNGNPPTAGEADVSIQFYWPSNTPPAFLATVIDVDAMQVTAMEFLADTAFVFSAAGGARLKLVAAAINNNFDSELTFDSSVEIVLTSLSVFSTKGPISIHGKISGLGGLSFVGADYGQLPLARVLLGGSTGNTYGGTTHIRAGIELQLNKSSGVAIPHNLVIYDFADWYPLFQVYAVDTVYNGTVKLLRPNQIADGADLSIEGVLDLNGHNDTIRSLTLANNGRVRTGAGTLTLEGDVTKMAMLSMLPTDWTWYANQASIEGNLALGSVTNPVVGRTFTVARDNVLDIPARISGLSLVKLRKVDLGELRLSGTNNYAGQTLVDEGLMRIYSNAALGATNAGTVVADGAWLFCQGNPLTVDEPLALSGSGGGTNGALQCSGTVNWRGNIVLNSDAAINTLGLLDVSGSISGPGGLAKIGSNTLILSGPAANTYGGGTAIESGVLQLAKSALHTAIPGPGTLVIPSNATVRVATEHQIADSVAVNLLAGGQFAVTNASESIASLKGEGTVALNWAMLSVGADNSSGTLAGTLSGANATFNKVGTGTLTLTGTNSFTGSTTVNGGKLLVNGSLTGPASAFAAGSVLGGNGSVGPLSGASGQISPGDGPGMLQCQNLSCGPASMLRLELNGLVPGANCDLLDVHGTVNLGGCQLNATLGFISAVGNQFVLVNNDGADAVSGTFAGLPEGATLTLSGAQFQVTYHGGDGNDVMLTQLTAMSEEFAPVLSIVRSPPQSVRLSWTASATGFQLYSSPTLLPDLWTPVPEPVVVIAGRNTVTVPAGDSHVIFRLVKP